MSNLFLTQTQIEDTFKLATLNALGINPLDPDNQDRVRIDWPTEGAPAWGDPNKNVTFIRIGEQDQDINRLLQTEVTPLDTNNCNITTGQTRVINVQWIFYGLTCFDDAFNIKRALFLPVFHDNLAQNQIYLIPTTQAPVRSPELYNGRWWNRTNLTAQFNELVKLATVTPYLQTARIEVINDKGDIANVNIGTN